MKEAEVASRKAVELDPELTEAHVARGLALRMNKKYKEAHKEFETAIQLNPKLFDAYYFYARLRYQRGELAEAAQFYERACWANPEDFQAPMLLGPNLRWPGPQIRGRSRKATSLAHHREASRVTSGRRSGAVLGRCWPGPSGSARTSPRVGSPRTFCRSGRSHGSLQCRLQLRPVRVARGRYFLPRKSDGPKLLWLIASSLGGARFGP